MSVLPSVGQGTWRMGEDASRAKQEIEALRTGIELGLTLIDTAEMYADGGAEKIVGEAVRDCRHEVFIVTKVLPSNATYSGVMEAVQRSLERLGTTWIDMYLLHWPSATIPIEETMQAFEDVVDQGLVHHIGVSNFDRRGVEQVLAHVKKHPLACNQVLYHLRERGIEYALLPHARANNIQVMAYSPFGQGDFPGPDTKEGKLLEEIGAEYGKTPHQVALNFLVTWSGVVAIPKASNVAHVKQNAGAMGWELSSEHIDAINQAFPRPEREQPLAVL